MKLAFAKNSTNKTVYIFILDSSSTVGAGLTGLTYASGSLACYYIRPGTSPTVISLAAQTIEGGWVSGGFVEVSSTNMPGIYRLDIPNAVLASGASHAVIMLKGATNMAPVSLEIQLSLPTDIIEWNGYIVDPGFSDGTIGVTVTNTVNANLIAWNNSPVANLDSQGFIPAHLVSTDGVMIRANVVQWNSNDIARSDYPGYPKVTIKSGTNTGELNINGGNLIGSVGSVTNTVNANVIQVLGVTVTDTVADVNVVKFNGVAVDPAFSDGTIGVSVANTVTANVISWNGVTVDPAFSDGTIGVSITGTPAVNVTQWNGDSVPTSNVAGIPKIDLIYINGSTATESSTLSANVTQWNGVTVDPAFSDGTIGVSVSNTVNANLIAWNNSPVANLDSQGFIPAHLVSTDGVMIRANVVQWNSNDIARSDYPGYPKVTIKSGTGAGELNISSGNLVSGVSVDNAAIADAVWDELRSGHVISGSFGQGVASVQGSITGSVASVTNSVRANVTEWQYTPVELIDSDGLIPVSVRSQVDTIVTKANVVQWNNNDVPKSDTLGYPKVTLKSGTGVGELSVSGGALTGRVSVSTSESRIIYSSTCTALSTLNTIHLDLGASTTDSFYVGCLVKLDSGTGIGQVRIITAYVGSTQVATVDSAWVTSPSIGTGFTIVAHHAPQVDSSLGVTVGTNNDKTGYRLSATGIDDIFDEVLSGHTTVDTFGQRMQAVRTGTAQAGASGTITLDASASSVTDFYKNALISITAGTGANQCRTISEYNGTTKVATITPNWGTTPSSDSVFFITPTGEIIGASAASAATIADAVWDEAKSGHTTSGTFGESVSLVSGSFDSTALSTIADAILKRDFSSISGESARSMLNALRKLINSAQVSGSTLTVYKENGSTVAYTQTVAGSSSATPITGITSS